MTILLLAVFCLGFASGFLVCLETLVKRGITIAKAAVANAGECLDLFKEMKSLHDESTRNRIDQIHAQIKRAPWTVH